MFLHSLKATETHTHMERRTAHKPRVCILWIINIYGQCLLLWRIATICTARLAYHTLRACHVLQKNLSSLSSEKYISPENLSKNIKKSFCYMLCYVPTTKIFAFCLAQMLQGRYTAYASQPLHELPYRNNLDAKIRIFEGLPERVKVICST